MPLVAGAVLVSPFLVNAVPTYLHGNSSAPGVQGVGDINSAILSTRILPLEWVLPLFLIILAFALFSKRYSGRFFTLPTLLLSMWLFVPLFLTQGYLFGFIIDYNKYTLSSLFNNDWACVINSPDRVLCRHSQNLSFIYKPNPENEKGPSTKEWFGFQVT